MARKISLKCPEGNCSAAVARVASMEAAREAGFLWMPSRNPAMSNEDPAVLAATCVAQSTSAILAALASAQAKRLLFDQEAFEVHGFALLTLEQSQAEGSGKKCLQGPVKLSRNISG